MSTQPPISMADLWREQIHQRTRTWNYLTIPLVILSFFLALWVIALFIDPLNEQKPLQLIITALLLGTLSFAGRWIYQYLEIILIRKDPLLQKATQAMTHIEDIVTHKPSRTVMLDVVREELNNLFKPRPLEMGLYDTETHGFFISTNKQTLPLNAPFIDWLLQQAINTPISLPHPYLSENLAMEQTALMERGLILLIPLGRSGWLGLGAPEQTEYTPIHQRLLQYLVQPVSNTLEHIRLQQNQQERAQELRSLYWIAQAVNFTMQLDDLMELIYTQLKRVMMLPTFSIAIKDADGENLSYAFYIENDDRLYPNDIWDVNEGLTGTVLRNSMTIRTDNYQAECETRNIELSDEKIPHAWMACPLTAGDKSVGVMAVAAYEPGTTFSEEDENFFVTVAAYSASILERHTLYDKLAARARQLGTLNEIGNLLASSLDLNRVLNLVVRNAARLLEAQAGSLLLLDEESGELVFRVASGPSSSELIGLRMPSDKGIAGAAFTRNKPIITHNTRKDQRWYDNFDKKAEFVTESIIAVPMTARGRTIGVLEVLNRKDNRAFNDEDAELILAFGAQSAIAIENAHLFTMTDQELQDRLEELTTLQLIDRQLNATLDYNAVMKLTLEWAIRMTGTEIGLIAALQEEEDGTKGLRLLAHQGYDEDVFHRYSKEELWPLKKGLTGYTVQTGKTTLVTHVDENPYYDPIVKGMKAQLTVPIKREERVTGVIALESEMADRFKKEAVTLLERLADHAAIAIENARLYEQIRRANDAKTEFVSFVSHELKQPMTAMKGYTDLLMKGIGGPLNEQQQQFVQVIRNNVGRMNELVQSLLDISRIESGRLKLTVSDVVPDALISEAVQAFGPTMDAKNQTIKVDIEANLPTIKGDRSRLLQVLTNLVSNANKYTPEGGVITIFGARMIAGGQEYVRWSVQDTGIGMTPEEQERLFTKYFRSSSAAVRSVQGTGLGLVITRSIIEMHGGTIWVESEYQKGSTFSFAIPIEQN